MMTKAGPPQLKFHVVTIEDLVAPDHFLRKVDRLVDFSFIYEEVRELYSSWNGRPSTDPVRLVKYLLIGYLKGIESEREIEEQIRDNNPYRWFLGLDIGERVPDHSTISQNRRRRFNGTDIFRKLFERILQQCIELGLVDGRIVLTDSTHVKANASKRTNIQVMVERETTDYMERLDRYEAAEREALEAAGSIKPKRPSQGKPQHKQVKRTVSTTDPDAGMLHRPGKPDGMHYLSHQSVDAAHGIVVDVAVTPGNANDSGPYLSRIEYMREHLGLSIEMAGADGSYGTSLIYQRMEEMGIQLHTPKATGGATYKVEFKRENFRYDEKRDTFVCPMGNDLTLRSLEREQFNICRVYRGNPADCRDCPMRKKCVSESQQSRAIRVNIFEQAVKRQRQSDGTPLHKHILNLRQIWCEGTFAAQKARHNLRHLFRRGLEAAEDHCLFSATASNIKRMIKCLE